jgi:hypothetical protein
VFDYQLDMFETTLKLSDDRYKLFQHPVPNAIVESLLLHIRILCDILLSRCKEPDDITLTKRLPGFTSPKVNELENLYGSRKVEGSPCWKLNKMLAHATSVRSEDYNHSPWVNQLLRVLLPLIDEIQRARKATKPRGIEGPAKRPQEHCFRASGRE